MLLLGFSGFSELGFTERGLVLGFSALNVSVGVGVGVGVGLRRRSGE